MFETGNQYTFPWFEAQKHWHLPGQIKLCPWDTWMILDTVKKKKKSLFIPQEQHKIFGDVAN